MAETTKIAWAHSTFNPWVGCAKVSPACAHCYAETWAKRSGHSELWREVRRRTSDALWRRVRKWDREAELAGTPRRVFPSLCDPFEDHAALPSWRVDFLALVEETPHLTWMLCTKRPENVLDMVPTGWREPHAFGAYADEWPRHVWVGTTVEDQQRANERIPHLLRIPVAVRFLSIEPMLGEVDLTAFLHDSTCMWLQAGDCTCADPRARRVGWVIVGGESGGGARRMDPEWMLGLRAQCQQAGVPFFFKQTGAVLAREMGLRDAAGADPREWPDDWRVQEVP